MAEIYYESYYGVSTLGSEYLAHHGVKGMKWGVRRYQNKDGSLTRAGKARYLTDNGIKRAKTKLGKTANRAKEYVKRKRSEYAEKDKARAIERGNVSKVLKYSNTMSDKELKDALGRIDTMQKLNEIKAKQQAARDQRAVRALNTIKASIDTGRSIGNVLKKAADKLGNDKAHEAYIKNRDKQIDSVAGEIRKKAKAEGWSVDRQEREVERGISEFMRDHRKSPMQDRSKEYLDKANAMRDELRVRKQVKAAANAQANEEWYEKLKKTRKVSG